MPASSHLSEREIGQIIAFREAGLSLREIRSMINRSKDAVAHVLADPDNYGKRKRSGRPPKLTPRNKRAILNATNSGPTTDQQILAPLDLNVNIRTVQNVLHQSPNHRSQKLKKPALQNHHKEARLNFATKHISWSEPKTIMRRNFVGGSVMVWAGFSSSGKTSIAFLDGRQKASDYQRTLYDFILPVGSQLGGPQWKTFGSYKIERWNHKVLNLKI
ncbi:hypothetical protein B4U79_05623 [Dinothrombium tinctorium]|uniref:Transposase IS30-like HTH domain-containing protein n=1 Tax=Dinothrombium tinctorium TaxID=1965070 RepID=A0A3S4RJC5_9ACAR|nr:hypothetical protein B4U79_05623 [Dinothrombium tinctorium]